MVEIHAPLDKSGQVTTLIKWKSLVQIQDGALDRNNLFLYGRKCKWRTPVNSVAEFHLSGWKSLVRFQDRAT